jgi:hypothetical protein
MNKKLENRKQYWGILAPETASIPFYRPNGYTKLIKLPKLDAAFSMLPASIKDKLEKNPTG